MSKKSQIRAQHDEAEAITSEQFHDMFSGQEKHESSVVKKLVNVKVKDCKSSASWLGLWGYILSLVPILTWLPRSVILHLFISSADVKIYSQC